MAQTVSVVVDEVTFKSMFVPSHQATHTWGHSCGLPWALPS